ncbi:hypothetical protein NXA99_09845, partial [Citrobacter amalonaticus]|uniref:hypothetical protein n=1 Tax=Citrobacter amalonaticus TaxID=35703 RepID=UPI00215C99C2
RSADGSVGSPHVRVGNCQTSNKTKGSVERLGLLFFLNDRSDQGRHQAGLSTEKQKAILMDGLFAFCLVYYLR